eukprot:5791432-Pleurochrysis_carterae.AAC.1
MLSAQLSVRTVSKVQVPESYSHEIGPSSHHLSRAVGVAPAATAHARPRGRLNYCFRLLS